MMLIKKLFAALAGRQFWLKLKRKYVLDKGVYVLLMPESDNELNICALKHLDEMTVYRKARGVLVLTNQPFVAHNATQYSHKLIGILTLSETQIDRLLTYYEFCMFSERLITISLTRPYGNKAYRALAVNGITLDDIVCLGLLLIRNWKPSV